MKILAINVIQFIFVFQMLFGILLLRKKNAYLGLCYLLVFASITMAFNLFEEVANTRSILLVTPLFLLGKGPLYYLFVYQLIYPEKKLKKRYLFHLLPMVLALPLTYWPQVIIGLGSLSQLIYVVISVLLIVKYHKASFAMRSDAEALQLFWLIKILLTFLVIGLLDLIRLNLQPYIPISWNLHGQLFENTAMLVLFSFLIYKATLQEHLFTGMSSFEQLTSNTGKVVTEEYSEITQQVFVEIEQLIISQALHHQPRLSLNDLAHATGLNSREISRTINQRAGCSFCDYINNLRVADIKERLADKIDNNPETKINLLALAFEVGFNSKSSFNAVFKRVTGVTPTQYMKNR